MPRLHETLSSVEQQVADRTEALSKAIGERAAALEKAETARHQAEEASHLKDQFLSTASHELRTPLNAIVGWVHILQTGAVTDAAQRQHAIDAIERNAKVQTRLIDDLLDVSRMIQGRVSLTVSPQNLRAIVDAAVETIRPAAAAKEITVDLDAPDDLLPVIGDDNRLLQVVWNLLANALKYTPRGGRVLVSVAGEGDRAMIRVTDSGEGIDPGFLPCLLSRSARARRRPCGAGWGLVSRSCGDWSSSTAG